MQTNNPCNMVEGGLHDGGGQGSGRRHKMHTCDFKKGNLVYQMET